MMKTPEEYVGKRRITHVDEWDPASGRGWVVVKGQQMAGHIFFHLGDDSAFTAKRSK